MRFETLPAWLEWLEQQHPKTIDLGLERVGQVAARLQLQKPQSPDTTVITVAGTNGKGSFVATLNALLSAQGKSTACYTSPHFLQFNERIQLNNTQVSDEQLLQAFAAVDNACEGISLSYFEYTTLAALWCFQQQPVDCWILEVGLGGRLDAVNIVEPDWAVITSIGLDHQDYLGDTLEHIAAEKCGILRESTPLICAEAEPPAPLQAAIESRTAHCLQREFSFQVADNGRWSMTDQVHQQRYDDLVDNGLSLPSQSGAVVLANTLLQKAGDETISADQLQSLLAELQLPGRFQHFEDQGVDIYLDVAHNPQAAEMLQQRLAQRPLAEGKKRFAVFNMAQDKDVAPVIGSLKDAFTAWFLFEMDNERMYRPSDLAAKVHEQGINMISVSKNARQAFARAKSLCEPGDQIVVFGSFFVVAELLPKLNRAK